LQIFRLLFANGKPDYDKFPALQLAEGFELTLEHGETLYARRYWHHMVPDSGFAMSLGPSKFNAGN
jgi:hypothetical protein